MFGQNKFLSDFMRTQAQLVHEVTLDTFTLKQKTRKNPAWLMLIVNQS